MRGEAWLRAGPVGILVVEYLVLSFLVDFPLDGPALPLVTAARLLVPVVIGAGAAGWLLARHPGARPTWPPPPRPRLRALAAGLHLLAFGATTWLAVALLAPGAPPPSIAGTLALVALALTTTSLAIATAVPLGWLARATILRWRLPVLAVAVGLLAWRGATAAEELWGSLSDATLRASAALLRLVTSGVQADAAGNLLDVDGFTIRVAPVCSGADGVGLVVTFLAVWIALARDRIRPGRALLLLPLGALAAWAANVVRISALVLVGARGHEDLALGGLHSKLGWILFTGVALAGVALAEHLPWFRSPGRTGEPPSGAPEGAAPFLAPLLATMGAALLTGIWARGPFDSWYGIRAAAGLLALLLLRGALPRPSLRASWGAAGIGLVVGAAWVAGLAWQGESGAPLGPALLALPAGARTAWVVTRVVGAVLVVPVVEELAFRGFLLPWLSSPDFERAPARAWTWPAVLLSSLAFGAIHAHWVLGTLAGAAFAAARLRRGLLADAVLAHATANAVVAVAALSGRWELWG